MKTIPTVSDSRVRPLHLGKTFAFAALAAGLVCGTSASSAANATWNGTTDGAWATTTNWSASPVPGTGNTATFQNGGNGNTAIDLGAGVTLGSLTFDNGTGILASYTIGSGGAGNQTLTFGANGATISVGTNVMTDELIDADVVFGAGRGTYNIVNNGTADLTIAGDVSSGGAGDGTRSSTLQVTGTGNTIINGSLLNGSEGINTALVVANGTLTLAGSANNYTVTTIQSGTLLAGSSGALGTGTVTVGSNGATASASLLTTGAYTIANVINVQTSATNASIVVGGNQTSGTSTYSGAVTLNSNTTFYSAAGGETHFTGVVSGGSNLTIDGGGGVALGGANTFGGAGKTITIRNGTTLSVGTNGNLGATQNSIVFNNGVLKFDAAFDPTAARTLTIDGGGATIDTNGNAVTFAKAIGNNGAGGLVKTGAGTLTLNAANTYAGSTTVRTGTLALGSAGALASTAYVIGNGATFDVSAKDSYSLASVSTTIDIGATTTGSFDAGTATLTLGNTLTLNLLTSSIADGQTYDLFTFGDKSGDFSSVSLSGSFIGNLSLASDIWTGVFGGYAFAFDESTGILSVSSAIPEPATCALIGGALALIGAGGLRRRRRLCV